jgi:hypothetical protein
MVALDADGRPSFNTCRIRISSGARGVLYVVDVLVLAGKDALAEELNPVPGRFAMSTASGFLVGQHPRGAARWSPPKG